MERMKPSERNTAAHVAVEEGSFASFSEAVNFVNLAEDLAAKLHRIYERQCNGHQTPSGEWDEAAAQRDEAREEALEARLRKEFKAHGLGLYLQGDPRGNPVGILTPKTGKYNTMGGRECGWRL